MIIQRLYILTIKYLHSYLPILLKYKKIFEICNTILGEINVVYQLLIEIVDMEFQLLFINCIFEHI